MPAEIGTMNTNVEILPAQGDTGGSNAGAQSPTSMQDNIRLKEVLRPLVIELINEELENYMKMRG